MISSTDENLLFKNNITHILSIYIKPEKKLKGYTYMCIDARDNPKQDIKQFFHETNEFIHDARLKNGNVLVHCHQGISRSATIAIAYLMTSVEECSWRDGYKAVQAAHNRAKPNFNFQRQLLEYQNEHLTKERQLIFAMKNGKTFIAEDTKRMKQLLVVHSEWVITGKFNEIDEHLYPLAYNKESSEANKIITTKYEKAPPTGTSKDQSSENEEPFKQLNEQRPIDLITDYIADIKETPEQYEDELKKKPKTLDEWKFSSVNSSLVDADSIPFSKSFGFEQRVRSFSADTTDAEPSYESSNTMFDDIDEMARHRNLSSGTLPFTSEDRIVDTEDDENSFDIPNIVVADYAEDKVDENAAHTDES